MTDSFWAGGAEAHAASLRDYYEPKLDELRGRRDEIDESERAELDAEIQLVEAEYMLKLDSIDDALF